MRKTLNLKRLKLGAVMAEIENNEELQLGGSRLTRIVLTLVAVVLIFAGPTYITWLFIAAGVPDVGAIAIGFVLFILGFILLIYLIRKKIVS